MENEPKGFVFFSSYYEALEQLDPDIRHQICDAIFDFAFENKKPTFTGVANAIFSLIRPTLTSSLNRYQACVENGKKGGQFGYLGGRPKKPQKNPEETPNITPEITPKKPLNKDMDKDMDKDMEREKDIEKERDKDRDMERDKNMERENENAQNFSLSLSLSQNEIQAFKTAFPNRKLDLDKQPAIPVPPNFDMFALIQHIKQSTFLSNANNMGLASCIKNYDSIINGNYANFTKPQAPPPKESWERQYSPADLDDLFDKVEDIEV